MKPTIVMLALLLTAPSLSPAQFCEEEVTLTTAPGAVAMSHREALFNCCAWLDIEPVQAPGLIEFTEWERFDEGPCYCLCCFDAAAELGGLAPGQYTVRVWKALDNFDGTWTFELVHEEVVNVEGQCDPSFASTFEACVETGVGGEAYESTWGTIKALYR